MKLTTMKRYFEKTIVTIFSSVALALLGSCDIGLGPAVDMTAPEIEITSHKDNDYVGSIFAIRGTAIDNEKVTKITVDFSDADIHYQVVPGAGEWQKKTSASQTWQTITSDSNYYCKVNGNKIEWSIGFDSNERIPSKTDSSYTIEASALDEAGNSGRKSKAVCTITIDENNPIVEIYKPELTAGTWDDVESARSGYQLKDGNIISRLMNGTLLLQGRLSNAISFKALRIEFDDGKQQSGIAKYTSGSAVDNMSSLLSLPESSLGDDIAPTVYYAKEFSALEFRDWSITVNPEEWVTAENGLSTGNHVIRVVSTCLSASNAWERKILGYFVWWPEADTPWLSAPTGNEDENNIIPVECYPGSSISGSAQDDDGIESIVSTMYVKSSDGSYTEFFADKYSTTVSHKLPQENAKYSAWSIEVPSLDGFYKYVIKVTDIYGNSSTETRYFKTSDVSAPKIEIASPIDNTSAIVNEDGNISFNVTATDDGQITLFALAWLNPALRADSNNKIKYLTGTDANWNNATAEGWVDDEGNIIYRLDDGTNKNKFELKNRTFNLYNSDKRFGFNIGGKDKKGRNIPLCSQDFIFLASDGNKNTVKSMILSGDNITPEEFSITKITIDGMPKNWDSGVPVFPSSAYDKEATLEGKWKDMLTSGFENKTRLYNPEVTWGNDTRATAVTLNTDGTWTAIIKAPNGGGTITAKLTDFGGNTKVIQKAASIETSESGLSRIDCLDDDGSYKAGKEINLTLEFTKNVDVDISGGTPSLTLNNGGVAYYVSGTGTTSHVFKYVVGATSGEKDTDDVVDEDNPSGEKVLWVKEINKNGAKWKENGTNADITDKVTINSRIGKNIKTTRKIKIDNAKPSIKSITPLSSKGNYKADATLLFMLEFSEDVTITGVSNLNMEFNGITTKTTDATATGSKYVLLTYIVDSGDNASPLTFKKLNASGVKVTDAAGNELSGSNFAVSPTPSFEGFVIDTEKPNPPSFGTWEPGDIIIADDGTSFTLAGTETDATVEYSLDGGTNWLSYTEGATVEIKNNGSYTVTARQTDKAGNISNNTTPAKQFTINKGNLLNRITAESRSGLYTDSKTSNPTAITGKIEFRTAVTLGQGSTVTLNVKNGSSSSKTIPIKECTGGDATKSTFSFEYTVTAGDSIESNGGKLDVTAWDLKNAKLGNNSVVIVFPVAGNSQKLSENRDIKILTGRPSRNGNTIFNGEGTTAVLKIPFNRAIEKGTGDIVFEYDDTISGNEFHVPTVLTAEEYGELSSSSAISTAYSVGMNGATKESGNTLKNDTSTKYILDYKRDDTDLILVSAFKTANKHKVTVPIISDQVSIDTDGKTLKIELGETYKLPVKGAKYKVTVPVGAVYDDAKNSNEVIELTETAAGVEVPQIRINRTSYEITNAGTTSTANANMSKAQTATMRIDCRTPGATVKYSVVEEEQEPFSVKNSGDANSPDYRERIKAALSDATVSETFSKDVSNTTDTPYPTAIPLGAEKSVSTYSDAKGLRIAIAAQAEKGTAKAIGYEYANRTVLKFSITRNYSGDGKSSTVSHISENGTPLTFGDLKVWIIGGDKPSGTNSLDPFPLSWGESKYFKLMHQDRVENTTDAEGMAGTWYWVTWDLNDVAYHGFVIGDVPSDAGIKGPTMWYAGECAWVPTKEYYPLYPGATLSMEIGTGTTHTSFFFRLKNEGKR